MPTKTKAKGTISKTKKVTKNPWVEHVKQFKRMHPNLDGNLFQEARKTYRKTNSVSGSQYRSGSIDKEETLNELCGSDQKCITSVQNMFAWSTPNITKDGIQRLVDHYNINSNSNSNSHYDGFGY